jgi:hypothetical protein
VSEARVRPTIAAAYALEDVNHALDDLRAGPPGRLVVAP